MPYIQEHPIESETIMRAGAYEIVMALHELHQQGYEQLRLLPGMSPNGCCWRWHIYPKQYMHGCVEMERYGNEYGPQEEHPFGSCGEERSNTNIEQLIAAIKTCYPEAVELGKGEDHAYIEWYAHIVEKTEENQFPIAFVEYSNASDGWGLGNEVIPYPPYDNVGELLLHTELAGFGWYEGDKIWGMLKAGKRLRLVREHDNKHDKRAVAVYFSNTKIGYIPKKDNKDIAQILDEGKGNTIQARILFTSLDDEKGPRVSFSIYKNTQQ